MSIDTVFDVAVFKRIREEAQHLFPLLLEEIATTDSTGTISKLSRYSNRLSLWGTSLSVMIMSIWMLYSSTKNKSIF